jgi:hypothetical protein
MVTRMASPDRPTARELVEAVREFLERDVMSATEGRVQFHTRVAINALGMVERELSASPAFNAELDAATAAERELGAAVRAGDDRRDEVRERVRQKLLIANPGYLP